MTNENSSSSEQNLIQEEIKKRRTFAIISHPDAGKTTLTEKLLLYSGMIHTAGMVRGRKERKAATSDWMGMEQERGISITASAMQFSYEGVLMNVLDTPGHEDFSEDTYRTLTAADFAIMVIDAGKGVEKQTVKLFEVCKLRGIPVITFVNKMDMPGKDPLALMEEVENVLGIHSFAANFPIGQGKDFCGVYDRFKDKALIFEKASLGGALRANIQEVPRSEIEKYTGDKDYILSELEEGLDLLEGAGNPFSLEEFLSAKVTPVFFGSALVNFGIEPFFQAIKNLAPHPSGRLANEKDTKEVYIDPITQPFSGYIFKIQANMDPKHRDSLAFLRICSGRFEKDVVVVNQRTGKEVRLSRPHSMQAGERAILQEAYPGDILGVINPGAFAIGDTLSIKGNFQYKPLPKFQPEYFARVSPKDIGKRKAFDKGIAQLSQEGAIQVLYQWGQGDSLAVDAIVGAVGKLQFDVMQYRLKDEYGVETLLNYLPYRCSAWLKGDVNTFKKSSNALMVKDILGRPLVLFSELWEKEYSIKQNPEHKLLDICNE